MGNKSSGNGSSLMNLLKQLGLNQYESRIYASLLSLGTLTAGELAESSNVPRSRVYDVLTSLEKKGFAIVQVGRPIKYLGIPIESAVSSLKSTFEDEFTKKLDSVSKLENELKATLSAHIESRKKSPVVSEDFVGILKGKNNLYNHIKHLIGSSDTRIVKLTNEAGLANLEKHCKFAFEKAKKRGVKAQILADAGDLKTAGKLSNLAQLRAHKGINGRFLVKDSEEVVLVTNEDENGIWIKSPYFASALEKLFDHAWEKGKPLAE